VSWWGALRVGDHVRARRDLAGGFLDTLTGGTAIPEGRRGIVREVGSGLLRTRYAVEFEDGFGTRTLRDLTDDDLRRGAGHGESSWQWGRDVRRGVRLGLFVAFTLPALLAAAWYFLQGGTPAGLVAAVVVAAVDGVLALLGPVIPLLVAAGVVWLVVRGRAK